MADDALPFSIRVTEGDMSFDVLQPGKPPGQIDLVGRALPYRPIKYKRRQRHRTSFNPGSPSATQQLIGPTLEPTTISGIWKDRYLGDGQARLLADLFDQICARGPSVRVTWGSSASVGVTSTVSGSAIVRVGIIESFEFRPGEPTGGNQDIGWEMTFAWRSDGLDGASPIAATAVVNPKDGFRDVTDSLTQSDALWQAFAQGPTARALGLPQQIKQRMDTAFGQLVTATDSIANATAAVANATVVPATFAKQVIGALSGAVQAAITAEQNILAINMLRLEVRDSAVDLLRLKDQFFTILGQLSASKERASDASTAMQAQAEPDVIAEVRAPAGTDLRDLAFQFYGDPDQWFAIAQYNGIDGSAVPSPPGGASDDPNLPIMIPRLQAGTSSDLRMQC